MKDIAIIICNFNKKEYLKQCLESLFTSDINLSICDVIVVDNASTDDAPQMVKDNFSNQVILLENEINTGGSGGFARGINYVIARNYKYLALLDNDIRLETNTISELKKHLELHEEVAIVGSKICTMDQPDVLQELGSFIDLEKFNATTPLKGHRDSDFLPEIVECDYVPACCLLSRMDVVKEIGAFDINHFIYWDDMDWCTKAKELGYKIHAINSSRVFHKMGAINTVNTFSQYYFERNRILYFLKHLPKEGLPQFTEKISEELINLTFFSNEKGKYNSAISTLLGIDDLERNSLGRQDDHILEKEQSNPLDFLSGKKDKSILLIATENMQHLRQIYNALSNFFTNTITIATDHNSIAKLSEEFSGTTIVDKDTISLQNNELVFYAFEHIMQAETVNNIAENAFLIDYYLNVKRASEIKTFIASFNIYKSIFMNIFKPVLEEKFNYIYARLHS